MARLPYSLLNRAPAPEYRPDPGGALDTMLQDRGQAERELYAGLFSWQSRESVASDVASPGGVGAAQKQREAAQRQAPPPAADPHPGAALAAETRDPHYLEKASAQAERFNESLARRIAEYNARQAAEAKRQRQLEAEYPDSASSWPWTQPRYIRRYGSRGRALLNMGPFYLVPPDWVTNPGYK
jgi:hypothetical protein